MVRKLSGFPSDYIEIRPSDVNAFLHVVGDAARELLPHVESVIDELLPLLTPRVCFSEYDIEISESMLDLGFAKVQSADLAHRLDGCRRIILLASTVGIGADRLIAKYSLSEPSRALTMQAAGAAAVERFLDRLIPEISEGRVLRERFSCGYGDLPLELQKDIFAAIECEKNIGVTLNTSLLMTPTKSVTAIIGIE